MREWEIKATIQSKEEAEQWVEAFASARGLVVHLAGSLTKCPGSLHWHLGKPGRRGTLEATYWPRTARFWFKVAANRGAPWIDEIFGAN